MNDLRRLAFEVPRPLKRRPSPTFGADVVMSARRPLEYDRRHLLLAAVDGAIMPFVILTGASGAGKTTIAEAVERLHGQEIDVFYKDRIGVPPVQEMVHQFGSVEGWQRAAIFGWMARLSPLLTKGRSVLFEGQARFSFLAEAAERAGIGLHSCILIDCDDDTRARRLSIDRGQPELANPDMMNWAAFLRHEAAAYECKILDTSNLTLEQGIERVLRELRRQPV
ncbi:AAA family ATPase [Rhizobium etli]|uniref:AAA family ATPase n=1 Tax=Rhizobium etli TaxID=29449 RepID=UPI001FD5F471|nr:AAA family ATPase [Rhizobium etli]